MVPGAKTVEVSLHLGASGAVDSAMQIRDMRFTVSAGCVRVSSTHREGKHHESCIDAPNGRWTFAFSLKKMILY